MSDEAALKTHAEAYRLAQEAHDMRLENERLRAALHKAAGQLGYLSTVLSHSNKTHNATGALEWSRQARAAAEGEMSGE